MTTIDDERGIKDFKSISFSGYKRTDVKKELLESLKSSKLEPSCYWSAELICAGHFSDLWNIIIYHYTKTVHLGNPKFILYLEKRIENFRDIVNNGYVDSELSMRNNIKIRTIFAEIISILCLSTQKHSFQQIKLDKEKTFDLSNISERFKAPSTKYGDKVFKKDDPKEIFIAVNELAYHLSNDSLNSIESCYWIEWLIEYQHICQKRKKQCICERRSYEDVNDKFQKDIIWIIWDIFFIINNDNRKKEIIKSLLKLFTLRYTTGCNKSRRYILYMAVSIITENVNFQFKLINNKNMISSVLDKIDNIYKQVKKNEIAPKTDYLFMNTAGKSNLDKTIEKLDLMDKFL
tara:strand:+ start:204 stop:1247 length:1044 start_codon:yes stop_codon:yes gene_type:complete